MLAADRAERSAITEDIKATISSDPLLKNSSANVATHGRVVTLTGQVPDDSAHLAAYKIATGERGVTKVNDLINVPLAPAESDPAHKSGRTASKSGFRRKRGWTSDLSSR